MRRHCDEGVDSLIIAAREDPLAVLEALFPSLALSGSLVLYSAYKEVCLASSCCFLVLFNAS